MTVNLEIKKVMILSCFKARFNEHFTLIITK